MADIFPEPEKNRPAPPPAESAGLPPDLPTTPPPYPDAPAEPAETLGSTAAEPPAEATPPEPAPASEWLSEESASIPAETPAPEPAVAPPQETQALPPRTQQAYIPNAPLSESDERTWSTLAHLSVILTGFVGAIASLIIYLAFKDRSRSVGFQSLQAFLFHIITWVAPGILVALAWAVSFAFPPISLVFLPFAALLTALLCLLPLASIIYGVYAAVEVSQGKDFRYWLLGDWVKRTFPNA